MGMASANSGGSEGMELCIFDLRRGQQEGQELDKILFFFPADLPFSTQLSVIGLSEGLITFTRIFSPEAACEVIEAERHSHVFYEAEPDIWMVMVVEKSKEAEAIWRVEALREVLKEIHSLFMMFYGPVREMLEKDPSGGQIRAHLYPFVMDYLSDFLVGKKIQLPSFRDCLKECGTVQMLTVGREAAIEVQSLVRVLESGAGATHCYSLILFQDLLVSTTLSPDDTINLFAYAVQRLSPRALSPGVSSWSYLRRGSTPSHVVVGPTFATVSVSDQFHQLHATSPSQDNSYHVKRPLQHNRWSKGKDGFLVTDIWGTETGSLIPSTPTIWLQQTGERMYLCAYQYKSLTLILLVPLSSILNGEQGVSLVKQQVLENASLKILKVEEKLSKGWGGENAYHVSGYRYLLIDDDRNVSRASPPAKVTTLAKESLLAMSKLREEVDLEKSRSKWDNADRDKDLEICIRAKNNAWVIARTTRGKELYMVLERANETLLYASDAFERFSDRYCGGAFSLD
uniref:CCZ1/INTU/HSP4 first Longin domain-containing protein n=1 Tax=Populus davidiana TaxID=266767 RepID=A0A6M2E8B0_9ROSI